MRPEIESKLSELSLALKVSLASLDHAGTRRDVKKAQSILEELQVSLRVDEAMGSCVPEDLRTRCAEILAWHKTGVLDGDALRGYAAARWYANEHNALQMAEMDTAREAFKLLAAQGGQSHE